MMTGRTRQFSSPRMRHAKAAFGMVVCLSFSACSEPPEPEQALRDWVRKGAELAEQKDRRGLVAMISSDYADARGNDRESINDLLRIYFLRAQRVALLTRIEDLRVHGTSAAELTLAVGMAGTDASVLGFSADAYRFEMELERQGNDWLLIGARWAELGETLR